MTLILLVVLIVIIFGVYYYFKLRPEELSVFKKKGLAKDFEIFIECLLHQTAMVPVLKGNILHIKDSNTSFALTKFHDRISVVWTWSSKEFGQRGKEWSFPYTHDQFKMYEEISTDIALYQKSTYLAHNLTESSKSN